MQWFANLSWSLPHLTHLIQIISTLLETARPDLGVPNKRDIQNVQGRGASRTGLKTTAIEGYGGSHHAPFLRVLLSGCRP